MLNTVSKYASRWQYSLNADKSVVMVVGETSKTRTRGLKEIHQEANPY